MNDLIIPAIVVAALFFLMKKSAPTYIKVLDNVADYDEVADIPAHPSLYRRSDIMPTPGLNGGTYVPLFAQTGTSYTYAGFVHNTLNGTFIYAGQDNVANYGIRTDGAGNFI